MPAYGQPGHSPYHPGEREVSIPEPPPYDNPEHEVSDIVSKVLDKHTADAVAEIAEQLAPRLRGEDAVNIEAFEELHAALRLTIEQVSRLIEARRGSQPGGEDDTPQTLPAPYGNGTLLGAGVDSSDHDGGAGESLEPELGDQDPGPIQRIMRTMTGRGHE